MKLIKIILGWKESEVAVAHNPAHRVLINDRDFPPGKFPKTLFILMEDEQAAK